MRLARISEMALHLRPARKKRLKPVEWLTGRLKAAVGWFSAPFHWLFVRLPKGFTLPFLFLLVPYLLFIYPAAVILSSVGFFMGLTLLSSYLGTLADVSFVFGFFSVLIVLSVLTLAFLLIGLVICHGVAGKIYLLYRRLRARQRRWGARPAEAPAPLLPATAAGGEPGAANPLAQFHNIGIILSGGGAKGAYQAGAVQAIYEFLEEHGAHHKVRMIAGTSIGSWNALFWLAGLVKKNGDGTSPLQRWWSRISVGQIIRPITYLPTRQNYFLSNEPWKENFDSLFKGTEAGRQLLSHVERAGSAGAMHFYFTRSNIGKANLAYTTNRRSWGEVTPNFRSGDRQPFNRDTRYQAVRLEDIRAAVFSSMDLPPLFKCTAERTAEAEDFFEDGGVIDNLPIRFGTEIEGCDLLFILPLNASFETKVEHRSVIRRLARVTDVRQGVLERNSFKMIYLYNEIASLRDRVGELEAELSGRHAKKADASADLKKVIEEKTAANALRRTHGVVRVFSICPAPELIISTTEFWKTREAGQAFDFMYRATRNELKRFTPLVNSKWLRMVQVSPAANGGAGAAAATTGGVRPIRKTVGDLVYDAVYFRDF